MWTSRLHDMRDRAIVVIGRHPDAARINDKNTITHDDARNMGMPTQHELRITGPDQAATDSVRAIEPRLPCRDIFQEIIQIPSGRTAMTGEHPPIQQPRCAGKRPEPFPMVFRQARTRIGVGGTRPTCQQLAFMIACHRYGRERHLKIRTAGRVERPGNQIPQIDDQVGIFMRNITQHGVQSQTVPMDIGDHGNLHAASIFGDVAAVHAAGRVHPTDHGTRLPCLSAEHRCRPAFAPGSDIRNRTSRPACQTWRHLAKSVETLTERQARSSSRRASSHRSAR